MLHKSAVNVCVVHPHNDIAATQHTHVKDLSSCLGVEGDAIEDHAGGSLGEGDDVHEDNVILAGDFLVGNKGQYAYDLVLVGVAMLL